MLKLKITRENLKDIGAEFLFENKCQPYAEGVNSALDVFNSVVETEDAELKILRKLVQSYSNKEKAPNNAADLFEKGIIDFYQFVLNYEDKIGDLQKENRYLELKYNSIKIELELRPRDLSQIIMQPFDLSQITEQSFGLSQITEQ